MRAGLAVVGASVRRLCRHEQPATRRECTGVANCRHAEVRVEQDPGGVGGQVLGNVDLRLTQVVDRGFDPDRCEHPAQGVALVHCDDRQGSVGVRDRGERAGVLLYRSGTHQCTPSCWV